MAEDVATDTRWLDASELAAWKRLIAVVELLPTRLDAQLRRDAELTHFEYYVLAMLSEAPKRTLRMTALAGRANASLSRLSHVVQRLEDRGLAERTPCAEDARASNARLTQRGWRKIQDSAPAHVETARALVMDALSPEQVAQLADIAGAILRRLDPAGRMTPMYEDALP
jgi:DNA-binding MarR family transcriptional regulator